MCRTFGNNANRTVFLVHNDLDENRINKVDRVLSPTLYVRSSMYSYALQDYIPAANSLSEDEITLDLHVLQSNPRYGNHNITVNDLFLILRAVCSCFIISCCRSLFML
ncbi:hypothetical protein D3C71_1412330 [compost metagenome]